MATDHPAVKALPSFVPGQIIGGEAAKTNTGSGDCVRSPNVLTVKDNGGQMSCSGHLVEKSGARYLDNDGDIWSTCAKLAETQENTNVKGLGPAADIQGQLQN